MQSLDRKRITGAQLRAARALVRWSAEELATMSGIGVATVRRAEADDGELRCTKANENALRGALEAVGVEFMEGNGHGPGVRSKQSNDQS